MNFLSVCSGLEAASVAWAPLGWTPVGFSEIEKFPAAVLAHHYPDVPNYGDMTLLPERIKSGEIPAPDMLCGGTPCQAFSVAGLRQSLDDARGNLSLVFCEIANAIDTARAAANLEPAVIFWENVPGVLNTKDNAFGCFLAGLAGEDDPLVPAGDRWTNAGCVYGPKRTVAWRVLDAQYFGVAQRRRRVFVVSSARDVFDPFEVLFESDGVRRDTAPSREAGQETAAGTLRSTDGGCDVDHARAGHLQPLAFGGNRTSGSIDVTPALLAQPGSGWKGDFESETFLVQPVPFDTTQITSATNRSRPKAGDPCHPLAAGAHEPCIAFPERLPGTQYASTEDPAPSMGALNPTAVAYSTKLPHTARAVALRGREGGATAELGDEVSNCLRASGGGGDKAHVLAYSTKLHNTSSNQAGKVYEEYTAGLDANSPAPALLTAHQVRRLTPTECERLQGFPDGYSAIPWRNKPAEQCPDGPRYKALGNSWAVPVVRWIGHRIQAALDRGTP